MMRIGLVGCGHIGTVHAYVLQQLAEAELVDAALTLTFDVDPDRAGAVARHHGGEPAASLAELVAGVDVVWVCTWTAGAPRSGRARGRRRACPCSARSRSAPTSRRRRASPSGSSACRTRWVSCCAASPVFRNAAELIASGEYGRPMATVAARRPVLPDPGLLRFDVAQGRRARGRRHADRALDPRHRRAALVARRPGVGQRAHGVPVRAPGDRGHRGASRSRSPTVPSRSSRACGTRC